jgi:hypothetical protein
LREGGAGRVVITENYALIFECGIVSGEVKILLYLWWCISIQP